MDETAKQATHMCVGPRCWECGEPEELFHMRQRLIMPALFALREERPEADHHALARTAAEAIREDVLCLLGVRNQELDQLHSRLRDAEDARKAAVGVIQRQNEEIATLSFQLAEVDRNFIELSKQSGEDQADLARVRALCSETEQHPSHDHLCPADILKALGA